MSYRPIAGAVLQYSRNAAGDSADGYYIKFYRAGTTTPLSMATDATGGTTLDKCALNSRGEPISNDADPTTVFVPHLNRKYKYFLYPTATDADNNTTANALFDSGDLSLGFSEGTIVDDYAELRALTSSDLDDGDIITVTDSGIYGYFIVKSGSVTDNGGILIVFTDNSARYAERLYQEPIYASWFGAAADGGVADQSSIYSDIENAAGTTAVVLPAGISRIDTGSFDSTNFLSYGSYKSNNSTIRVLNAVPRNQNETVTVGTGGDFATVTQALNYFYLSRPAYKTTSVRGTINLLAGFVLAEQVIADGMDFSNITIIGADAETDVTQSSLVINCGSDYGVSAYPVFCARNGGRGPVINQLFDFDVNNPGGNKHGAMAVGAGSSLIFLPGAGVKNTGGYGMFSYLEGNITAEESIFTGVEFDAAYASRRSSISCRLSNLTNATVRGVYADENSQINAEKVDVSNSGSVGVLSDENSTVNAETLVANDCSSHAVKADRGGQVNCREGQCLRAGNDTLFASGAGTAINAELVAADNSTGRAFFADMTAVINANGGSGTNAGVNGADAAERGVINIRNVDVTGSGSANAILARRGGSIVAVGADATGATVRVQDGGEIYADSLVGGTLSQAANSPTTNGIIYQ